MTEYNNDALAQASELNWSKQRATNAEKSIYRLLAKLIFDVKQNNFFFVHLLCLMRKESARFLAFSSNLNMIFCCSFPE